MSMYDKTTTIKKKKKEVTHGVQSLKIRLTSDFSSETIEAERQ